VTNITAKSQPTISAIVPARNEEASIAQCLASLAQQPEIAEIIVVNDQSTDHTAAIVRELMRKHPQLRLLETTSLPPGWVGKNHAVYQGARAARGDWFLFTDADVVHEKNSASRALEIAGLLVGGKVDRPIPGCAPSSTLTPQLISFSPEQIMERWYEKSLIPAVYCRLSKKFDFDEVNDPQNKSAAANGQFLLISREAYDQVGGHAVIACEVLEDVALAQRVKQAGYRLWFGSGQGIVRVRMYRSFVAMWEGWTKNLYKLMSGDRASFSKETTRAIAPMILFALLVGLFSGFDWRAGAVIGIAGLLFWHWKYSRELTANHFPKSLTWYGLPGKCLYVLVLYNSYRRHQKGTLSWKGREYPVGSPRASNDASKR
jgi:glycosyltransferase involved in cell wall biosynthesis